MTWLESMALRILANENFPGDAVEALAGRGHDIAWVRMQSPGASDDDVISLAQQEGRLLVTFDKDFGELVFARGARASRGVVLFRISGKPDFLVNLIVASLESRDDWAGSFAVIEPHRIRITAFPNYE